MRFEVPQFIEIEDKIFGPFTWKQFVYLCGGVGWAIVAYVLFPFIIFVIIGVPIAGLALLLSFYPVNSRPFSIYLESIFNFYRNSNNYRWQKKEQSVYKSDTPIPPAAPTRLNVPTNSDGINSLARKLELKAIQNEK